MKHIFTFDADTIINDLEAKLVNTYHYFRANITIFHDKKDILRHQYEGYLQAHVDLGLITTHNMDICLLKLGYVYDELEKYEV